MACFSTQDSHTGAGAGPLRPVVPPAAPPLPCPNGLHLAQQVSSFVRTGFMSAVLLLFLLASSAAAGELVADSITDFAATQGNHGWHYLECQTTYSQAACIPLTWNSALGAWGGTGGARFQQPDATFAVGYDQAAYANPSGDTYTVRRWVSSTTGRISIRGSYQRLTRTPDSGTRLWIFTDGRPVFERTADWTEQAPVPYFITLNVTAGQVIDFVTAGPGTAVSAPTVFTAQIESFTYAESTQDFSSTQGANHWQYLECSATYAPAACVAMAWDAAQGRWAGPLGSFIYQPTASYPAGYHWPGYSSGTNRMSVQRWLAESSGTLTISGTYQRLAAGSDSGTRLRIYRDGILSWEHLVTPSETAARPYSITFDVQEGSAIDLVASALGTSTNDRVAWLARMEQIEPEVQIAALPEYVLLNPGWTFAKANVDGWKFWSAQLDETRGLGTIAAYQSICRAWGLQIISERMWWDRNCTPDQLGEWNADDGPGNGNPEDEVDRIARMRSVNGGINTIDLDCPFRNFMHPNFAASLGGGLTLTQACQEVIDYMRGVTAVYPGTEFNLLPNFPLWGWKGGVAYTGINQFFGDYHTVLETFLPMARAAGVRIRGVTCDNPYDMASKQWVPSWVHQDDPAWQATDFMDRIVDLERYCKGQGLEFNLIVNSTHGGELSMQALSDETLAFIDTYRERGGWPHRWICQSWQTHPTAAEVVPEHMAQTSTRLTGEVLRRVKGVRIRQVAADLNADLWRGWRNSDRGEAVNIPDTSGLGTWTLGWGQGSDFSMPPGPTGNVMGGWAFPDTGEPKQAWGYSWNGTHDGGWVDHVGFEVQEGGLLHVRGNDDWNGTGTAPAIKWTSGVSGIVTINFASDAFTQGALLGVLDPQTGVWHGDNVAEPDSAFSNAYLTAPHRVSFTRQVQVGDSLILAFRGRTQSEPTTFGNVTGSVIIEPDHPWIEISPPGPADTVVGPVKYVLTFHNAAAIADLEQLAAKLTLLKTGSADGTLTVSGDGPTTRCVTLSALQGTGTLAFQLAEAASTGRHGRYAPATHSGSALSVPPQVLSASRPSQWVLYK